MAKRKKVEKKETKAEKGFKEELFNQLVTLSTASFGLVAALAWNDAIKKFVEQYITHYIPGSGLISQIIYALLITLIAVLVTYQLSRLASRFQRKD